MLIELIPGIDSGISPEVPQAYNDTSTTHIIAISGFKLLSIDALYRNDIGKFFSSNLIRALGRAKSKLPR